MTTGVPIYLVSACTTGEEFVAAFRRYADRGSLFVPMAEPLPAGRRGRFALTLAGGGVLIEGEADVISSSKTPSVLHGRVGMTLRFGDLDDPSKTVLVELEKARLISKPPAPSVSPRVVDLPEGPRPQPPAPSVRIDASVALAECTALGNIDALEKTAPPKAGPKFVVPSVPPVGTPRPAGQTGAQPIVPSIPPVARPKTPSVPPAMPALSPPPNLASSANHSPSGPVKVPLPPRLPLDVALANASREIEAARTEAMEVPPAPLTPASMDAVLGPTTEVLEVPPAPTTPTEMSAVPTPATAKRTPDHLLMTMRSAAPPPPVVAAAPPVRPLEPDLDEPTDLTMMPIIPEDSGKRSTTLGVAPLPRPATIDPDDAPVEIVDLLPAELDSKPTAMDDADTSVTEQPGEAAPALPRAAKPPTIEEPTPSGDWTITPGTDAPTIEPRRRDELSPVAQTTEEMTAAPGRLTGNWTIQLDSASPDGWSEPSKVDAVALPDPATPAKKKRTKPTPETPPELRPVSRSIIMEALPSPAPERVTASEEPKVQIDPTLMEAPIVNADHGLPPPPATLSALMPAQPEPVRPQEIPVLPAMAIPTPMPRVPTPIPGALVAPVAHGVPLDRLTPSPIGIDPRTTPLPPSLRPAISAPTPPPGRIVTDGGVGFFRDSGDIAHLPGGSGSFPVGDSTSLVVAKRRRRWLVIGISAGLVVALGIVLLVVFAGGKKDDVADAPKPDASRPAVADPAEPPDAAKVASAPDAGPEADAAVAVDTAPPPPPPPAKPECIVEVVTVPPGAEVLVQGSLDVLGTTPVNLPLPCGLEVRLLVRKQRFGNVIRTLTPDEDGEKIRVSLAKLMFSVKVSSAPAGATISVNGKSVAVTPTTMKLPAFELSTVTFSKDGYAIDTQKITPKQNNQTVHAVLKKRTRR